MNTAAKLAAFAAVVAVGFGGAAAVGAAVGPIDVGGATAHSTHATGEAAGSELLPGLAVAEAGFRLAVDTPTVAADTPMSFGFSILDDSGSPVTRFDQLHERSLHLIVLSRNLVDYLHLHPVMDVGGHWTVDLPALAADSYRFFADFQPAGAANLTLGTDVTIPGNVDSVALPAPASVATIDGYDVTMAGMPAVGNSELSFTVGLDGQNVQADPYLGAAGHLVVIRTGDLAYLHVHPRTDDTNRAVSFTADFPTAGTYRLFFEFSHTGTVHTAAFTVNIEPGRHTDTTETMETMGTIGIHEEGH